MAITHAKVSARSDGADSGAVRPSDWNASHVQKFAQAAKSANYTLTASDETIYATAGAGGITLRLPDATANAGEWWIIVRVDSGAGTVKIIPDQVGQTINGESEFDLVEPYQSVEIHAYSGNFYVVRGY